MMQAGARPGPLGLPAPTSPLYRFGLRPKPIVEAGEEVGLAFPPTTPGLCHGPCVCVTLWSSHLDHDVGQRNMRNMMIYNLPFANREMKM